MEQLAKAQVAQIRVVKHALFIILSLVQVKYANCQLMQPICYVSSQVVRADETITKAQGCSNVWMSRPEQMLVQAYLNKSQSMLEVGSGYSTLWFSQFVGSYVSIEHDAIWYRKVRQMLAKTAGTRNISYNVAPVKWDWSQGEGDEKSFRDYLDKIDELSEGRKWDIVLDDGRARVEVALRVLQYLHPDSKVIIHDFWGREHYHSILHLYKVVSAVYDGQSIVVLQPKVVSYE
eukprot:TRINITY_DN1290_c0_g3_i1.p4 TRINITY_DN1290_c0_g3~~TRINITY_DN1290_c0_g3_i1.p4  ORF type:complete len:255 (-),score=12.98 TRINITY_DN1290_c0_g3_i1:1831-2529(-)